MERQPKLSQLRIRPRAPRVKLDRPWPSTKQISIDFLFWFLPTSFGLWGETQKLGKIYHAVISKDRSHYRQKQPHSHCPQPGADHFCLWSFMWSGEFRNGQVTNKSPEKQKNPPEINDFRRICGGRYRTRTCDLPHVKRMLIPAELIVRRFNCLGHVPNEPYYSGPGASCQGLFSRPEPDSCHNPVRSKAGIKPSPTESSSWT